MPLKKDILSFIKTKDYEGLEYELKNLKTNQKFLNESLKWACFQGDAKSVEILIKFGANGNYADEFGTTVLHFAVKGEKQDVIIALLNCGANFDEWESEGINLMQWSIRNGLVDVLDVLVTKFNADLTQSDDLGRSNLHSACMFGQVNVVEYILATELLSIDERDENGWTPLHYACSEASTNFREMIQVLFKYNANPILVTTNNKTSLDLAYEAGRAQDLIDVLTIHKMLQLLISVDSIIVGNFPSRDANPVNQSRTTEADHIERQITVKHKEFHSVTKLQERHVNMKLSLWRKVMLNDDIELLQQYRDSGIWYDSENPCSFEECQELTRQNFSEIFRDCYENGVGLFSYFNENFRKQIKRSDFTGILSAISGISKFSSLTTENYILFSSFQESILFLAFITGRFKVVEMLLKMRQFDIIPTCLIICLITSRLEQEKKFSQQIIDTLCALGHRSELIAVDVLNRVYFKDNSPEKQVTLHFLNTQLSSYGNKSLIDLADAANCSNFLSLPCCQLILDKRWYGNLRPLRSHLKWVIRFLPVTIFLYNPYNNKPTGLPNGWIKSKLDNMDDVKIILQDKSKKVAELHKVTHQESQLDSLNRFQVLYAVVNAPGTKFFYHSLAHFIFLIIMSYIMLFEYHMELCWMESLCYSFVLGYGIEEARQCVLVSMQTSIKDYLNDKWNWLDISAILSTTIGLSLRLLAWHRYTGPSNSQYNESMDHLFYISRIVLLTSLLLFYLRILFIASISAILGPKLRMIGDMLRKDFLPLFLLFVIFILAFGVLFQGLLYPNGWHFHYKNDTVNETVGPYKKVSELKLEIIGMLLKRAIYAIFEADFPIEETACDSKVDCVHPLGSTLVVSLSLMIYIVIVYIMLMNLLIALFSNTVARINQRSIEHWLADRYKLVEEYKERSIFPPPFNIFERFFNVIFQIVLYVKSPCCKYRLACSYRIINQPESELNIVVKFIIIQSFALKTCRYALGSKNSRNILSSTAGAADKKSELELRAIKDKIAKIDHKLERIIALIGGMGGIGGRQSENNNRETEEQLFPRVNNLKYQEYPMKQHESKRNSRMSVASSHKPRDVDNYSPREAKSQEWNNAMDVFKNILNEDDKK